MVGVDGTPTHTDWYDDLDYRLPQVKDLTNGVCRNKALDEDDCNGVVGATPSSRVIITRADNRQLSSNY
ncbi:hypothetical protein [Gilliamella sp. ESL0250]|uniref:hypothetical protein n=1 Tax=Gilliamella sp. ESL0250 TaxID=2705036 RepID=UPI00157FC018|nr:hypothetical protein [Gilliamella sp. ESL0250]NUF49807.1 hypothetical protein [Gilliamella sp. ESL0250]